MIRVILFLTLLVGSVRLEAASAWPWRGVVTGEFHFAPLAELGLRWELAATERGLVAKGRRPGIEIDVAFQPLGDEAGRWSWQVAKGTLDLAELWPLLRPLAGAAAAEWSASGRIELSGEGEVSAARGPTGELRVALREGWARSDALKVEVSGLEMDLRTKDLTNFTLPVGQVLRIARVLAAEVPAENLRVEFGVSTSGDIEVSRAEVALLGGQVWTQPFQVSMAAPVLRVIVEVDGVRLSEVAKLTPWALARAKGKLKGRVEVAWDKLAKLRILDGGLDIVPQDDAGFTLAPSPGLLTGKMPIIFTILPAKWAWARKVGLRNPAYPPLKDIELGREGLVVETLHMKFRPDGPDGGRAATIHVVARPATQALVESLVIDLNFHGPWSEFLAFGINQEASFGLRFE